MEGKKYKNNIIIKIIYILVLGIEPLVVIIINSLSNSDNFTTALLIIEIINIFVLILLFFEKRINRIINIIIILYIAILYFVPTYTVVTKIKETSSPMGKIVLEKEWYSKNIFGITIKKGEYSLDNNN